MEQKLKKILNKESHKKITNHHNLHRNNNKKLQRIKVKSKENIKIRLIQNILRTMMNKIAINNKIHKKEINSIIYIKIKSKMKNRIINKIINLIFRV